MIITSANAVFMLGIANLYNVPVQIKGFSMDDMFASEDVAHMEKYMGVDGLLSAGYTPYIVPLDFVLQADSPANDIMDALIAAEKVKRDKYVLNATVAVPSLGRLFTFTTGFLDKGPVMPSAGKVLKPRRFSLAFQDMTTAPL